MSGSTDSAAMVLHVPHSSVDLPTSLRSTISLDDRELETELLQMTDWFTDELFQYPGNPGARVVRFPVSRLLVDPERFLDDAEEPMASRGMGVVYTATASGRVLRPDPDATTRQALIDRFYEPHHRALELAVEKMIATRDECVVVDCHSFPSVPLPYEICQDRDRPDLCIGTDSFHTPKALVERIQAEAESQGLSVAIGTPFSGSLVPMKYYRKRKTVFSVMLEVNRRLYMDEATGQKSERFEETRTKVGELLSAIEAWREATFKDRLVGKG
jgi:N-formylglutamate amidohydrolase